MGGDGWGRGGALVADREGAVPIASVGVANEGLVEDLLVALPGGKVAKNSAAVFGNVWEIHIITP